MSIAWWHRFSAPTSIAGPTGDETAILLVAIKACRARHPYFRLGLATMTIAAEMQDAWGQSATSGPSDGRGQLSTIHA
jgi:hypothetical protein